MHSNLELVSNLCDLYHVITVIIPTLNESQYLPGTLRALRANASPHEVLVADGGSDDDTVQIAKEAETKVICARPGRAQQMNIAAHEAKGEVFLFLHADTQVGSSSLTQIVTALENASIVGGGFARQFETPSLFLKLTCALTTWRCRALGWFLGDQAIFVRRQLFESLGGFKPMRLCEDLDFARRLKRKASEDGGNKSAGRQGFGAHHVSAGS